MSRYLDLTEAVAASHRGDLQRSASHDLLARAVTCCTSAAFRARAAVRRSLQARRVPQPCTD